VAKDRRWKLPCAYLASDFGALPREQSQPDIGGAVADVGGLRIGDARAMFGSAKQSPARPRE